MKYKNIDPAVANAADCDTRLVLATDSSANEVPIFQLLERTNRISAIDDREILIEQSIDLMLCIAGGEIAILYSLNCETNEYVITYAVGCQDYPQIRGLSFNSRLGLIGEVLQQGHAILSDNLQDETHWYPEVTGMNGAPLVNAMTVPMMVMDQAFGAIQIFNFTNFDLEIQQYFANRLAIDIEKQSQLDNSRHLNQRFLDLICFIDSARGVLNRDMLLRMVTEHTSVLLNARKCSLFLNNAETGELEFQISYQDQYSIGELEQTTRSHRTIKDMPRTPELPAADYPGTKNHKKGGNFKFVTRSAITVPIISRPLSQELTARDAKERVIGGLIAINEGDKYFSSEDVYLMEIIANHTSTLLQVSATYEDSKVVFIDAIKALVAAIDAKDPYTQGHSSRVCDLSVAIAKEMDLGDEFTHDLLIGSIVHDIGKIGIPDQILNKPGKLTPEEYDAIKKHTLIGQNILSQVKMLQSVIPAVAHHHERLNGSGYPLGLHGAEISMMGRIIAVADVYDAMTSDRPYRNAIDKREVLSYLKENASTLFDPPCVEAMHRIIEQG